MGSPEDIVSVDIGADTFEGWTAYEVTSDLLTPADAFMVSGSLIGTREQRRQLRTRINEAGRRIYIYIQRMREDGTLGPRALQMVGCVDTLDGDGDRSEGGMYTIRGTDNGGLLTRSSADPRLGVTNETTLIDLITGIVEPYGLTVITEGAPGRFIASGFSTTDISAVTAAFARSAGIPRSAARTSLLTGRSVRAAQRATRLDGSPLVGTETASEIMVTRPTVRARRAHASGMTGADIERLTLPEAKPAIGETVWDFIDRHCRRLGVMPWIDAEGRLVISSPDYDQDPLFSLRRYLDASRAPGGNNILKGGYRQDYGALASECTVYGRTHGADASRSPFHATVANPNQSFYRPLVISDPTVRSVEEAERRAQRELGRQNESAFVLEYEVASHGQGSLVWAQDTVVDVVDEEIDIEGLYYLTSRILVGEKRGPITRLRLIPLGAIEL